MFDKLDDARWIELRRWHNEVGAIMMRDFFAQRTSLTEELFSLTEAYLYELREISARFDASGEAPPHLAALRERERQRVEQVQEARRRMTR